MKKRRSKKNVDGYNWKLSYLGHTSRFLFMFVSGFDFAGLAKPSPVIETFCADELVSRYVKLDGLVTLVDCKHAMQHLNEVKPRWVVNEAVEQVAYADRIILNKVVITADQLCYSLQCKY